MPTSPAPDPTDDEVLELTERVSGLRDSFQSGKVVIAPHLLDDFVRSLEAIRLRPDGLVDPTTVDGRIRSAARAVQALRERHEAKRSVSLAHIQEQYFGFLFRQFDWLYRQMVDNGATPVQVAARAARDEQLVSDVYKGLPELADILREFWEAVSEPGIYHLQDTGQLKATFAGDLFPGHSRNVVSTAGLYLDTIVLPCPVMRIAPLLKTTMPKAPVVNMLLKHVLTAMTYRDVALADVDPPIAVVLPNGKDLGNDPSVIDHATPAILRHAGYLFGRDFESLDHLTEYCQTLVTVDQVLAELKGPDRLLFATEYGNRDARAQLTQAMQDPDRPQPKGLDAAVAGNHVLGACVGRMPQAFATSQNAADVGGTPLIHAETSWLYYTWFLEYGAAQVSRDDALHVARALLIEREQNLDWLGNVPPSTVVELRKAGLAGEVREILGHGISELVHAQPSNFFRTADQVVANLDRAFSEHQRALREARDKKLKFYGIDVPACLAPGVIGVAAALTGSVALGAIGGAVGIVGLPNLREIRSRMTEIAAEDRKRRASPTGLLFRHLR